MKTTIRQRLLASTLLIGMSGIATPAFAQDEPAAPPQTAQTDDEEIVVTGTLFQTQVTPSPVTQVTAEDLDRRGINTVQEAIQQLSSNNGPALTNSFTANGAFAGGASAVSLRGLSTNSTLVLFDGQRAAYYPLADDGSRNFVDLNTIPDDIVERIEVLRDGASSTYGADAIAGVVNIITRREFQGLSARAEAGISEDGNNANQRLSLMVGTGDLDTNGINAYLSGFYFHNDRTYNRDLPSPFNSDDQTGICFENVCGPNNIVNSRDPDSGVLEAFLVGYDTYVRPYDATNTTAQGRYELLNPTAGCQYGPGYQSTAGEQAALATVPAATPVCTVDITNRFGTVSPEIQRFGGSGRVTARLNDTTEAYFMVNFQQSTVEYEGFPPVIRGQANAGILFKPFSTSSGPSPSLAPGSFVLTLPVYVCPNGVGDPSGLNTGCNAGNGVLNPNNPYAAAGQVARIIGRPFTDPTQNATRSRVYRAALGVTGTIFDNWDYRVDATAMHNDLRRQQNGYVYIANLLSAIAQGTVNLVNPEANSQQVMDFIMPENITNASSDLYAIQASLNTSLAELPGGPLQLGVGGSIRYEAVDAPSANSDANGPTQRYFTLNAFGTSGSRTVYSAFAELNAPIIDQLEVNLSGRYDNYSSGQSNFSPKAGVIFRPIPEVTLRGTYSRGFRIPSFGEANALPTTGYVSVGASSYPDSFLAQYGCSQATFTSCPNYIRAQSIGITTLASPNLQPEKSRSFTAGIVLNPIPNVTLTVDYYNIRKTGAITTPSNQPALDAYFACTPAQVNGGTCPIPTGYNVIPGAPDINTPGALPAPAFIESALINANTIKSEGLDFGIQGRFNLGSGIRWRTSAEASYILELSTTFPDGSKEEYQGTLGNFNLTAGSGTPRWHGSWVNSLEWDRYTLTGTVNWFGGYDLSAADQGDVPGDCGQNPGYVPCRVGDYFTLDMVAQVEINDHFTFYFNVINALDNLPPIDPVTYGAYLFNAVQGGTGIFGRQFRAGVRVNF
jgi:iron complex outermembrane receptor protein